MSTRRPVLGIVSGLVFGVFTALSLALFGVVALDSVLLTIIPIVGLALGIFLGLRPAGGAPGGSANGGRAATTVPPEAAASAVAGDAPAAVTEPGERP